MSNGPESLRKLMTEFYRAKYPWKAEPTLGAFRQTVRDKEVIPLVDKLIAKQGPQKELQSLRLLDFIDL